MYGIIDCIRGNRATAVMVNAAQNWPEEFSRSEEPLLELCNGDQMNRPEFHAAYKRMPEKFKAELLGGIVYVASPVGNWHGRYHGLVTALLAAYAGGTPGVEFLPNVSVFLSEEDEVQPDVFLRVVRGGRSRETEDEYIGGPPELCVEVAHSSRAIDLHIKKERYAKADVGEYVVLCVRPLSLFWFNFDNNAAIASGAVEGIFQSKCFPGLWIDAEALLKLDYERSMEVVNQGLASPEHARFVQELERKKPPGEPG